MQAVQALLDGGDGGLEPGQQVAEVLRGLQGSKESKSASKRAWAEAEGVQGRKVQCTPRARCRASALCGGAP